MQLVEEMAQARSSRVAIVASRWHAAITDGLIAGALSAFEEAGGSQDAVTLIRVPGTFEIPFACKRVAEAGQVDGIVAVGVLLEGETEHFRLIADSLGEGLQRVMLETALPVGFGVVIAAEESLAVERSKIGDRSNRGYEAMVAVLEMINLQHRLKSERA